MNICFLFSHFTESILYSSMQINLRLSFDPPRNNIIGTNLTTKFYFSISTTKFYFSIKLVFKRKNVKEVSKSD